MTTKRTRIPPATRFLIRRAALRDLDLLVLQRRGMWADMGVSGSGLLSDGDRIFRKWAKREMKERRLVGWIVEAPDHIVSGGGCLWLRPTIPRPDMKRPFEPYLVSMFTEPRFRRKGVATRIVNEAIAWCVGKDYSHMLLHASKKGRRLYQRSGFTRTWEMHLKLGRQPRSGRA